MSDRALIAIALGLALIAASVGRGRHRLAALALALRAVGLLAVCALVALPPAPPSSSVRAARGIAVVADASASMALAGRAAAAQRTLARLGAGVASVTVAGDAEPTAASAARLGAAWPVGAHSSRLAPAVARALASEPPPEALVLLTDGELEDSAASLELLPARCPPVRAIVLGPRPAPDVSLGAARIDPIVFAGSTARITARVRATGLPRAFPTRVTATDARGVPLGSTALTLDPGDSEVSVALEVTLANPGAQRIRLRVVQPDGDPLRDNDFADLAPTVLRDRLRVLLLAGRPSFDLRALRRALRAHGNLDLVSFYILRTDDDLTMASNDELSLIPFPTDELFREHLGSFDAVFIHDLDPAPYGLDPHMPALARYVTQGGALALVGATALASEAYRTGPIAPLLPALPAAEPPDPAAFEPAASALAAVHPLTRELVAAPLPLAGAARFRTIADDTRVLLAHPALATSDGQRSPVLAVRRTGAGRVLLLATDSIWRLGFPALASGSDPERLGVFWDRALAWLAGEAGAAFDARIDRTRVEVSNGRAGEVIELALEQRSGARSLQRITLDASGAASVETGSDLASARVRTPSSGEERVAYAPGPLDGDERAGVGRGTAFLEALRARCGGDIVRGEPDAPAPREVSRAALSRQRLRPYLALALALVALVTLGLEWFLRRTRGAR